MRLLYRRRRYVCPACGKRFSEDNGFVGRYMRFTHRTAEKIMQLLRRRSSCMIFSAVRWVKRM